MSMNICQRFGIRIRELRTARGITLESLAERSGLSRQYIGDVERGTRNISLINIEKIAKALGISLFEFFDFK